MPPATPATPATRPPFDLKSTAWLLTALRLHTSDVDAIATALQARFGDSPGLFDDDPLVLDISPLRDGDAVPDFEALLQHLQQHRMQALAVQGGNPAQMAAARAAGLVPATEPETRAERPAAAAPAVATAPADAASAPADAEPAPPPPSPSPTLQAQRQPTLVVDKPLRSGQRVYARGADLVVLSSVSFGAEVIADGHIHVYGPLRGRAMAGARGDTTARIFSTALEPQLMSIAGIYRTAETPLPAAVAGRPAQVRLEGDSILIEPLA
jgi:septum site-determining protein MinC